jgi:hypothetical protein
MPREQTFMGFFKNYFCEVCYLSNVYYFIHPSCLERKALDSSKMLSHFLRAKLFRGSYFKVLRGGEVTRDPAGAKSAEEAHGPPRGKRVPGAEINGQSYKAEITIYVKVFKNNRLFIFFGILG